MAIRPFTTQQGLKLYALACKDERGMPHVAYLHAPDRIAAHVKYQLSHPGHTIVSAGPAIGAFEDHRGIYL